MAEYFIMFAGKFPPSDSKKKIPSRRKLFRLIAVFESCGALTPSSHLKEIPPLGGVARQKDLTR